MSELPDDLDVARQLVLVRANVMQATLHVRSPKRSTRYRTTRNLIIAGAAIAVLTAGAVVAQKVSQGYIDSNVACFEHASLDSLQLPVMGDDLDPVDACGLLWRTDAFNPDNVADPNPNDGDFPVPDLVVCTSYNGYAAVFPREDGSSDDTSFCAALGLADWDSD